jgi:Insertion element 4 transposase N-terminal
VLAATGTTQTRIRVLPSRVVVYLLLAGCLFAELGYRQVWDKMTADLGRLPVASPGDNALWQARARLGTEPVRWLFDLLRGPATAITAGSVRWHGLLVCAIDGTTVTIPDSPRDLAVYGKLAGNHGGSGYSLRLVALTACGTRTLIRRLRRSLTAGMVVLPDRNFDVAALLGPARRHERRPAGPRQGQPRLPVLRRYRDGSYPSQIGAVPVWVTECQITIATSAGRHTGAYRLTITLLDPPATRQPT